MKNQLFSAVVCTLLGIAGTTAMATEYGKVMLACHRGENLVAPENTMAAYNLGWKQGDRYLETDIQLTKDGKVVICHDPDTYRTSGNKQKVVIKDATLEEVRAVDVGSFKGEKYKGEKCPTLDELYDSIPDAHHGVYTEIKSGIDVVPAFVEIVKQRKLTPEQVIVISFHADALEASKKGLPEYKHYFLANYKKDKAHPGQYLAKPNVDDWIATAKKIGADGLDLQAAPPLDEAACKKIADAGLELHIWTVDDVETAKRYVDWGAKSITTNRAHGLGEELAALDKK